LVEAIELEHHPFFVASQFHPEFKSRPERPAPLFAGFIAAALKRSEEASPGIAAVASQSGEADATERRGAAAPVRTP
jgi:CTP synthase